MKKIIYGFILLFSISAFSQDYKFGFSSRYPITYDSKGDYIRGAEEKVEGSFFFGLTSVDFELKGDVYKKLTASGTSFDDRHPDLYEMVTITAIQTPSGKCEIKLYQFLDRRMQVFSSCEGKDYLYVIDKAIAEDGTVYGVKI